MKRERPLDWAMIIDAEAELADLQSIKQKEIKLMTFCQWLKDERQCDKITEIGMGRGACFA